MTTVATAFPATGEDNEIRLVRRLWSDPRCLAAVRELGLVDQTIRRFRLGLKEPYLFPASGMAIERAIAFPVLDANGVRRSRWSYLPLDGVTVNAPHPVGWGPGQSRTCYSRPVTLGSTLLLVDTPIDLWLVSQVLGAAFDPLVVACRSHPGGIPPEWRDPRFWRQWRRVVIGLGGRPEHDERAGVIGRAADRELHRCAPPGGGSWADLARMGGSASEVRQLVEDAPVWTPVVAPRPAELLASAGDYEADPVAIEGAFIRGLMHHPLTMERREIEERGTEGPVMVQRYVVRVLRSDGVLLDVERLPAPRGTPAGGRIVALSDGTRIVSAPQPGRFDTWRFASVRGFIEAREAGREPDRRDLDRIAADVEAHLRSSVWLPHPEDYALATAFVIASFVHRVFDAFPILLVNGAKATGKSELGQAIASVGCNGVVAGRITSAGLVRLLAESRGVVVLDDLEAIGSPRGAVDDVAQVLKTSYKAGTARRVTPGRDGRVEVLDYFSPKVVTNVGGADPVLLSRMVAVRTRAMPDEAALTDAAIDVAALRDELHTWAMCEASAVREAYAPLRDGARDRRAEIAAPLRAIAAMLSDCGWSERLEEALAAEPDAVAEPVETMLARALRRLVEEEGAIEIAMPRLQLELAASANGALVQPSAETLGRLLLAVGAREPDGEVSRRRFHGEVTRVYRLSPAFVARLKAPDHEEAEPFAFCAGACGACRYEAVCTDAAPGLKAAKLARRGGGPVDLAA